MQRSHASDNTPSLATQARQLHTGSGSGLGADDVGSPEPIDETLSRGVDLVSANRTLSPILHFLTLHGKPYSLARHFAMNPMFDLDMPRRSLWKTGRQLSKSTSLAANDILRCVTVPYFDVLFITPLYEQIRRLSGNYVKRFLDESKFIRNNFIDGTCSDTVFQRSFNTFSTMYFSFAYLDCERVRGIACDKLDIDEAQNIDFEFLPVMRECMSASDWRVTQFSGTPKTLDNTLEKLWQLGSQAEWVMKCESCGHWNIPNTSHGVMKMIGKETIVCAKCTRPLNPYSGHWEHAFPEKRTSFVGRHVPQIIMPFHYADPRKWKLLTYKMEHDPQYVFQNEVLGESCDLGHKLITYDELREVCVLNKNDPHIAADLRNKYHMLVMGVDWGGKGLKEVSYTTVAIMGLLPEGGPLHVIYAERLSRALDDIEEAKILLNYYKMFGCYWFAHDYGGSGSVKEILMVQQGLPLDRIMPLHYVPGSTQGILTYKPPGGGRVRHYYSLEKARSLLVMITALKTEQILLPQYDDDSKEVLDDLLNLIEDKFSTNRGADVYVIGRNPSAPDDFAHSVNYASVAIYHSCDRWPSFANAIQGIEPEDLYTPEPPPFTDGYG